MADTHLVHMRLPVELISALDAYAAEHYEGNRSLALRALLRSALTPARRYAEGALDIHSRCKHRTMRGLRCADCGATAAQIKAGA